MESRWVRFTPGEVWVERRTAYPQRRDALTGGETIVGYGAVFYDPANPATEYELWEDMRERIMPGAFDRALREKHDARGLFNHDPSALLGRVVAGTMRLSVDSKGLRYEIDKPDTQWGRDVATSIGRGDLSGSSFSFIARRVVWLELGDVFIRQVEDVDLFDVGPVTYPAYEATSAGLRAAAVESLRRELWEAGGARAALADYGESFRMRARLLQLDDDDARFRN